jgi:glycosyltransferase involved in cell wall biosynthesis
VDVLAYSDSRVFSGAESVFADVCDGLGRDVRLTLATPSEAVELRARVTSAAAIVDAPSQKLRVAAVHLWDPRRLRRARRLVRAAAPDALLVNLPSAEYGGTPVLAGVRRPVVGLLHVHASPREAGFRLGALRERLARPVLSRCDHVHAVAPGAAAKLHEIWGVDPAHVSPLPLPRPSVAAEPRETARDALGLPRDGDVVALVGRLTMSQKGHDVLLDAIPAILARRPATCFALAGDGPDRAAIETGIRQRGLDGAVRLLGQVDRPGRVLAAADAVVLPSRFEGLPLVALEALAAGRPGVVSDVDGLHDLWPAPWRVPPGDPAALAAAVVALLEADPSQTARLVDEGRRRMEELTSTDAAATVLATLRRLTTQARR